MWWALFVLLSCFVKSEYLYSYPVNGPVEVFVIGSPHKKADWKMKPDVRVCADTRVSAFRINHAISYWKKLGYDFGSIKIDNSPTCMRVYLGEILITLPDSSLKNSQIAATRIYSRTKTNEIIKAKIFIMPKDSRKSRVLEHEIGHALGWSHYNKKFHIMHSNWMLGGVDAYGLENKH
tara:strand:- start:2379 stop:2912 length:534 start_codon:yes stop_codon:yes gene_type:complete